MFGVTKADHCLPSQASRLSRSMFPGALTSAGVVQELPPIFRPSRSAPTRSMNSSCT